MQCHLWTFNFLYLLRSFSLFPSLENISIFTNRKRDIWNMTWHESPMTIFFKISADVSSVSVTNVWLTLHAAHIPRRPPATSSSYLNLARRVPGPGAGARAGGRGRDAPPSLKWRKLTENGRTPFARDVINYRPDGHRRAPANIGCRRAYLIT